MGDEETIWTKIVLPTRHCICVYLDSELNLHDWLIWTKCTLHNKQAFVDVMCLWIEINYSPTATAKSRCQCFCELTGLRLDGCCLTLSIHDFLLHRCREAMKAENKNHFCPREIERDQRNCYSSLVKIDSYRTIWWNDHLRYAGCWREIWKNGGDNWVIVPYSKSDTEIQTKYSNRTPQACIVACESPDSLLWAIAIAGFRCFSAFHRIYCFDLSQSDDERKTHILPMERQ